MPQDKRKLAARIPSESALPFHLISRYKHFLFDAVLDDRTTITGSCLNTGSMHGLTKPNSRIRLSKNANKTRKYAHALELVEADDTIDGINTRLLNRLVEAPILPVLFPDLPITTLCRVSRNTA